MVLRLVVDNDRCPNSQPIRLPYDPVVRGVAQGLKTLSPPIPTSGQTKGDRLIAEDAMGIDDTEAAADR